MDDMVEVTLLCVEGDHPFTHMRRKKSGGRNPKRCPRHKLEHEQRLQKDKRATRRQPVLTEPVVRAEPLPPPEPPPPEPEHKKLAAPEPPPLDPDLATIDRLAGSFLPDKDTFRAVMHLVSSTHSRGAYIKLAAVALSAARMMSPGGPVDAKLPPPRRRNESDDLYEERLRWALSS